MNPGISPSQPSPASGGGQCDAWLKWAERVDAWRLFPRLFVAGYGVLAWDVWQWVQSLKDLSPAQTAFTTAVIGLCIPLLGWYMNTGRKWQ